MKNYLGSNFVFIGFAWTRSESQMLPTMQPIPVADVPRGTVLRIVDAAGVGFPGPAQDWEDDVISLIQLLRLDRAASFVFRISGSSMVDAGTYENDVVIVDRDSTLGFPSGQRGWPRCGCAVP